MRRMMQIHTMVRCPNCRRHPDASCALCDGSGECWEHQCTGCNGTGWQAHDGITHTCEECGGRRVYHSPDPDTY